MFTPTGSCTPQMVGVFKWVNIYLDYTHTHSQWCSWIVFVCVCVCNSQDTRVSLQRFSTLERLIEAYRRATVTDVGMVPLIDPLDKRQLRSSLGQGTHTYTYICIDNICANLFHTAFNVCEASHICFLWTTNSSLTQFYLWSLSQSLPTWRWAAATPLSTDAVFIAQQTCSAKSAGIVVFSWYWCAFSSIFVFLISVVPQAKKLHQNIYIHSNIIQSAVHEKKTTYWIAHAHMLT